MCRRLNVSLFICFFFLPHPPVIFIPSQCMLLQQIDIKEGPVCVCWLSFQSRMCTWPLADRVDKWQCFLMRAKRAGQPHTSMMRSSICNIIYLSHWFLILALAHTPTRQHEKDDASNLPPPANPTTAFWILHHLAGIIREFPIILYGIGAVKTERKHGSGWKEQPAHAQCWSWTQVSCSDGYNLRL